MSSEQDARSFELCLKILGELRQEIVESVKLNYQIAALKGTFIAGTLTLFFANTGKMPAWIITIPVVSIVFFDSQIAVRRFVVQRNAFFIRTILEPKLREGAGWKKNERLWEEFLHEGGYVNPYRSFPFVAQFAYSGLNAIFATTSIIFIFLYSDLYTAITCSFFIVIAFVVSFYIVYPLRRRT